MSLFTKKTAGNSFTWQKRSNFLHIIAGRFKGRPLSVPKEGVRPTSGVVKEALFNICRDEIEGASFLDLFAGSGAIGLEALSRGASFVTFVDSGKESLRALKKNIELLQVEPQTEVVAGDALLKLKTLEKRGKSFDVIFADAPYGEEDLTTKILQFLSISSLLKPSTLLFIEEPKARETPQIENLTFKRERIFGDSKLIEYLK